MGHEPPDAVQQIPIPSGEREVFIGTVSTSETWSFSATGKWKTGFVWCGPDGYRNFFYDALEFAPRAPRWARLTLMGKFRDEPDRLAFPIGAGCTKTFTRSGELVAFANDLPDGYGDNNSAVMLTVARGGVAAAPVEDLASAAPGIASAMCSAAPRAFRSLPHSSLASPSSSCSCRRARTSCAASPKIISGNILPACCRSPLLSDCSSSRCRPGAGRESSSIRTTAQIAPVGGRNNCWSGRRAFSESCHSSRPRGRCGRIRPRIPGSF